MRKIKYSKSILVLLILIILLFAGCNFLKAVLPDTNEGTATTNTESTTESNEETATTSNSGDNSNTGASAPPDLGGVTEFVEQEVLVKIKPGADVEKIVSELGGTIIETLPQISVIRIKLEPQVSVAEAIQTLEELEEVEYAEPNGIYYMDLVPNDLDYDCQWAPQLTGAENAWDVTTGAVGVIVAITDTGVDGTHPDLAGKVIAGYDTYNNMDIPENSDSSVHPHGTHCAGIAAAIGNNNEGIAGVAWDCPIMPIKICMDNYPYTASSSDMAQAYIWAADNGANVISTSFGGKGYSQTMKDAVDYTVIDNSCIVVVSMGNSYCNETHYPAGYQSVIAVGATNAHDQIASFSEIYSTIPGNDYDYMSGTSMASPFVAGAAALVLSQNLGMSPEEVKTQLEGTVVDLGSPGFDSTFGYGRVNLAAAVGAPEANKYGVVDVLVTDRLDHPISGASVILWQGETVISTTNSNEDGHAKFEYIQAGEYGISVSFPGFDSCLAADNPVTVVAGGSVSTTISFTEAKVYYVSAYSVTLLTATPSSSIGMNEFQDKITQLEEKGILKPCYIFSNGSKRSIQNSTTPTYIIEVDWHAYYEASGYRVYKSVNGASYILILDWESPPISERYGLWDYEVEVGNAYFYYITAYGTDWETDPSEIVTIDTFLPSCSLISPLDGTMITNPTPVFEWSPVGVSSFPYGSIYYGDSDLWVYDDTGGETVWWPWFNDMTTSITTYNQDGQASPLVSGHTYLWESWGYGYNENGNLIAMSWSEDWMFTYTE
jgi:thermitase